jgi:predicted nucleic acid-binding protein
VEEAVIDASVAIKWVVAEPLSEQAISLLEGTRMSAPAHWQAEAVNGIWGWVHRGGISAEDAEERASRLLTAPVAIAPLGPLLGRALKLSIALGLTIYDSLYIALAEERGIPLVTNDRKLLRQMTTDPALAGLAQPLARLPLP